MGWKVELRKDYGMFTETVTQCSLTEWDWMHTAVFWKWNRCSNVNELLQCIYSIYLKQDDSNLKMIPQIQHTYQGNMYLSKSKMTPK